MRNVMKVRRRLGGEPLPYAGILATEPDLFVGLEYAVIGSQQVLWQDAAGTTTPVTAIGDPIGCVRHPLTGAVQMSQSVLARRPLWLGPGAGAGAQFDGLDDRLERLLAQNGTNSFTAYLWITQDDTFADGGSPGIRAFLWHDGAIRLQRSSPGGGLDSYSAQIVDAVDTSIRDTTTQTTFTLGIESFVALVVDRSASEMRAFLDGQIATVSPMATTTLGTALQNVTLGSHVFGATIWNGKIRAFAYLQNRVISDADLLALTASGPV
jgi:hypothetical protein